MSFQTHAQASSQSIQTYEWKKRYGCIAARIGADMSHRLGIDMPVEPPQYATATNVRSATRPGKVRKDASQFVLERDDRQPMPAGTPAPLVPTVVKAGTRITLTVEDITRYPEEGKAAHWVCRHPECSGKTFASKRDLLAAHLPNKDLEKEEQTHLYYAVFEQAGKPGKAGRPEKLDNNGKVVERAVLEVEPIETVVLLLSDEE